ncbi:MAG TPA: hypothetical protein VH143_13815 [Kofleriaceae bacterium]|jgi:hypothetical protein|nr:hypothetical protein [Kofleriaceae bacterium]
MRRFPVLVLFVALGCAKNGDEGMVVLANTAPSGTVCTFTGDLTQPAFSQGEIYADSPDPYLLTPLIESRFSAAGSGENVDRSILLQGADVTLTAATGGKSVSLPSTAQFTTTIAGTIDPGGLLNVSFPLVPTDVLQLFASGSADTEIVANVVVFGDEGGGRVNAEPFGYQVTVCPEGAPCVIANAGPCKGLTATVNAGNPCNPYQDGITTCCTSGSGSDAVLVCPAVAQM